MKTNILICAMVILFTLNLNAQNAPFSRFLLQVPTALHEVEDTFSFSFELGDYNGDGTLDLYAIKRKGESQKVEVHVLDGGHNFSSFLIQVPTVLSSEEMGKFKLGDYNKDGKLDLYYVKTKGEPGDGKSNEVHILNGADNFKSFLLQVKVDETVVHAGVWFAFDFRDYDGDRKLDLYTIQETGDGTPMEVYILSGADNFQTSLLSTRTVFKQVYFEDDFTFTLADYNRDGKLDIYAIKGAEVGSGKTEVHVVNGADNFQSFLIQTGTVLPPANYIFDFGVGDYNKDGNPDVYAIKLKDTGSGKTEVHIF